MKNRWKNTAFFAQVMVLCLCLAACGNSDDVAGDDWRTTGMVVDSGTITHDGDSVDVLVTVSESSAAFYRDIPEQVLFDSVAFPMDIPDAEQAFHSISFDDLELSSQKWGCNGSDLDLGSGGALCLSGGSVRSSG